MPRRKGTTPKKKKRTKTNESKKCIKFVQGKIRKLNREGYKGKQAVAIAYSYAKRNKACK